MTSDLDRKKIEEGSTLPSPEFIHIDVGGSCGPEARLRGHTLCDEDKREIIKGENGYISFSAFEYNRFLRTNAVNGNVSCTKYKIVRESAP